MNSKIALPRLADLITEGMALKNGHTHFGSAEFVEWRTTAATLLQKAEGCQLIATEFSEVRFTPAISFDETSAPRAFHAGMERALGLLRAAQRELQQQGAGPWHRRADAWLTRYTSIWYLASSPVKAIVFASRQHKGAGWALLIAMIALTCGCITVLVTAQGGKTPLEQFAFAVPVTGVAATLVNALVTQFRKKD